METKKEVQVETNKIKGKLLKFKNKKTVISIIASLLAICLICTTVISITNAVNLSNLSSSLRNYMGINDDVKQENDVIIGGEYTILDTTDISDAYLKDSTSGLDDKQKETLDMAKAVIKEVIKKKMTPFEKEIAIYKWMLENLSSDEGAFSVIPDTQDDCDNPYGVLKYHNAVCVGYATTFRMFMQMLDIECMVVHSTDLTHSWDLVKMGDHWYHVDIYYDIDGQAFNNFNLNDEQAEDIHIWDKDFFPAADSLEYNYAVKNQVKVKDSFEIAGKIVDMIQKEKPAFAIVFDHKLSQNEATVAEAAISNISDCISQGNLGGDYSISWNWTQTPENGFIATIHVSYPKNNNQENPIDDKTQRKIEKSIKKAFGTDWSFQLPYTDYADEAKG